MTDQLEIRQMSRQEVDELVAWAAREGWNPGLHDADAFWATDADAFIAAQLGDELIGGGAIAAYGSSFGFMGFFIVRPEFRGRGLGNTLWHARRTRLLARLEPGASIGMDGVFEMQPYYAKGGFVLSHRDIRYRADIAGNRDRPPQTDARIISLDQVEFDEVSAYDRTCFPAKRDTFLKHWIAQPDALALGCKRGNDLSGYGVIRQCREGFKIGPLFADDTAAAMALYSRLSAFAAGSSLYLDVPENNPAAMDLVHQHQMVEVFGCARMYLGPAPDIAHHRVFGVTTFEFG